MRRRLLRRTLAGVGAAAAVLASLAAPAAGAPLAGPTTARATAGATPAADTATPRAAPLTLPTGVRVLPVTGPDGAVTGVRQLPGEHAALLTRRIGGELYALPVRAMAGLGSSTSLADFDVSARVAGRPGRSPDGGIHPHFPMRTLSVHALDPDGSGAEHAVVTVINVDDFQKYAGMVDASGGEARISVPDGHYALMLSDPNFDGDNNLTALRYGFADVTVDGAATSATLRGDDSHRVSVSTPRKTVPNVLAVSWWRGSTETDSVAVDDFMPGGTPVYLPPSPAGRGVQHADVRSIQTANGDDDAQPYRYVLDFPADRFGADQSHTVTDADLATLRERFYSDQPGRSVWTSVSVLLPWDNLTTGAWFDAMPAQPTTTYVNARPDLAYRSDLIAFHDDQSGATDGYTVGGWQTYRAGRTYRQNWLRGPLAPGIPADTGVGEYYCGACRTADTMAIWLAPVTDSTADHHGVNYPGYDSIAATRFRLYRGDALLTDQRDVTGANVAVPADGGSYRVAYDQTRTADWTDLSTVSHTEWTFDSAAGGTAVPDRWHCGVATDGEGGELPGCTPVSLLLPRYRLAQRGDGTEPVGPGALTLTLAHSVGTADAPATSATVSVSFDGGQTWTATALHRRDAHTFRAEWANPASAAGRPVALRITATDTAGRTVTQTVHAAYTVAAK